jgi:hypothetical protein
MADQNLVDDYYSQINDNSKDDKKKIIVKPKLVKKKIKLKPKKVLLKKDNNTVLEKPKNIVNKKT